MDRKTLGGSLRSRSVRVIAVVAAIAAGIVVMLAGGATAANQHAKTAPHHFQSTARLETTPATRDVGSSNPGTRDVGFTG